MRQIIYVMSGAAHTPYLVASLHTLRTWWTSRIQIHAWSDSVEIVKRICEDKRLGDVECIPRNPAYRGKNAQFLDKIKVAQSVPGTNLYLDADTTIHGELLPLFDLAEDHGFVATQFCGWYTHQKSIKKRINRLRDIDAINQSLVDQVTSESWPSVNGGVWATPSDSPVLEAWYDLTWEAKQIFIADETVLHILQAEFCPRGKMVTIMEDGKYNSSPKLRSKKLRHEDVVVYHYHGDSNVRPAKSEVGFELWWPIFQRCMNQNIGYIREWLGSVKNKHFDRVRNQIVGWKG